MKRKIVFVVLMVILGVTTCFATTEPGEFESGILEPEYVAVHSSTARLSISGNVATYEAKIIPKSNDSIGRVEFTLKLVNSSGTVVKTRNGKAYYSGGYFKMTDTCSLSNRGTYHVRYTAKVYKGTSLLETINGVSANETY